MKDSIKILQIFDFDKTLIDSFEPEEGKPMWEKHYNKIFPYTGWWSKPESLDLNVFDIKPFPGILSLLKKGVADPDTYVIILTSRLEKLRPQIQAILNANNIHVDKLEMKTTEETKGERILKYISEFPDLKEIDVYDDKESNLLDYKQIENKIPNTITFRIFYANNGNIRLMEASDKLINIINEEIQNFFKN